MTTGPEEGKLWIQNQTWRGMDSTRLFMQKTCYMSGSLMTKIGYGINLSSISYIYIYKSLFYLVDIYIYVLQGSCFSSPSINKEHWLIKQTALTAKKPLIKTICPILSNDWPIVLFLFYNNNFKLDDRSLCINNTESHHHHIVLAARISLTLSRHSSLSFIALGRSSGQQPVSSHSCWMYVRAGRPAFARPCVGIHKSTSLMSSSLLLQQCPACLVRPTWIVFVIGGRWPYSWCLVGCCCQDLFRIVRSILV